MKNVREIGLTQWSEVAVAFHKAKISGEMLQAVIASKDNRLAQEIQRTIMLETIEDYFEEVKSFDFIVPDDFNSEYTIPRYLRKLQADKNVNISKIYNEGFGRFVDIAVDVIHPGQTFLVKLYKTVSDENIITPEDVHNFYRRKKVLFLGFQGLILVHDVPELDDIREHKFNGQYVRILCPVPVPAEDKKINEVPSIICQKLFSSKASFSQGSWDNFSRVHSNDYLLCFIPKEGLQK